MKKIYTITLTLFALLAMNAKAQFVQIDGKDPVFHIKFDSLTTEDTRLFNAGTDMYSYTNNAGVETNDTIEGHAWGGGLWSGFTFEDQEVIEVNIPTMFWNSYIAYPNRPQGIAAYSRSTGGYMGPFSGEAMTIAFYVNVSDSVRSDTANGAWDNPYFYGCGNWAVAGERVYMRFDPSTMKIWVDWGGGSWTSYGEDILTANEWTHVALTIPQGGARSDVKFYINGAQVFFDDEAGDMSVINLTPEDVGWDGIRVGALSNLWMADYRVYDVVLTESEIEKFVEEPATGIAKLQSDNDYKVYPNPNNGVFTVEFNDNVSRDIDIINMLGQTVHSQVIERTGIIDVNDLPKGTYFVSAQSENMTTSFTKIIVE
jgi:hypothetical protein